MTSERVSAAPAPTVRMSPGYWCTRGLARFLAALLFGWRIEGREHVPQSGGFIVAANHVSYADPPLIGAAAPRRLRYMAKRQLFGVPLLAPIIRSLGAFPVRREGLDRQALELASESLAAGWGLLLFPTGTRAREDRIPPARPGVSLLAARSGVPVVPAWIGGSARLRAACWRRPPVRIRFGAPIPPPPPPPPGEGAEHREVLRGHTTRIMQAIEGLAAG